MQLYVLEIVYRVLREESITEKQKSDLILSLDNITLKESLLSTSPASFFVSPLIVFSPLGLDLTFLFVPFLQEEAPKLLREINKSGDSIFSFPAARLLAADDYQEVSLSNEPLCLALINNLLRSTGACWRSVLV